MSELTFDGFPKAGVKFLKDLAKNNNRAWFEGHKPVYKEQLEAPAKAFKEEMCEALGELTGSLMDGKIYRFYRDVRFSKDKTPYNTYVRMSFFAVSGKGCGERPAFHFSFEATKVICGLGFHEFSKPLLASYQQAIDGPEGGKLQNLLEKLEKGGAEVWGEQYKRVPKPYGSDHPREGLIRRKGLSVWSHTLTPTDLSSAKGVDLCLAEYETLYPVFQWLENV